MTLLPSDFQPHNNEQDEMEQKDDDDHEFETDNDHQTTYLSKPNFKYRIKLPSPFRKTLRQAHKENLPSIEFKVPNVLLIEFSDHTLSTEEKNRTIHDMHRYSKLASGSSHATSQDNEDQSTADRCWFLLK